MKRSEMVDMLLAPLERMHVYKTLLTRLYSWADTNQTKEYELLGKASRRIGRLVAYISKYEYGIRNQNEMNKVQRFLGVQYHIIVPQRSLVRYGPMTRRTSNWTSRNKRWIFFLFSDLLLWTNKNGRFENCLQLRTCEVVQSISKTNPEKKFAVVSRGKRNKKLRLQCETRGEKVEWATTIEKTISKAKNTSDVGLDQAWMKFAPNPTNADATENSDDLSEIVSDFDSNMMDGQDLSTMEDDELMMIHDKKEPSEPDDPYNKRFMITTDLRVQDFKEIDPIGESNSINGSEPEVEEDEKRPAELSRPFEERKMEIFSRGASKKSDHQDEVKTREKLPDTQPNSKTPPSPGSIVRRSRIGNYALVGKPSTSQIIRLDTL